MVGIAEHRRRSMRSVKILGSLAAFTVLSVPSYLGSSRIQIRISSLPSERPRQVRNRETQLTEVTDH